MSLVTSLVMCVAKQGIDFSGLTVKSSQNVVSFDSAVAKHENSTCCNVFPEFNVSLSFQRWPFACGLFNICFFCYVEVSIRPFLNLARFRCSTRRSDTELLDQLIHNSPLLNQTWPFTTILSSEDNNVLLKLFVYLYFRVRKWSYLKTYKEERKVKEKKCSAGLARQRQY